ncbi:MAG: transporter, ATPase subunit [Chlamydiales bacterium]|jgi:lipoprotein-releasing system ATP-binding protein|nr:transporter, ATPase subunit [Chlamydiales bacterium]
MPKELLRAVGLEKTFSYPERIEILRKIDLTVHEEETIAICGSSGEGKSTLLHLLGSLDTPSQGELFFQKKPFSELNLNNLRNQSIGFIFQSFHLLEDLTALDNVLMPLKIARLPTRKGTEHHQKALELLAAVGLANRAHHLARQLSGGEKQRVAIARALINNPQLILADEPTGNLDHRTALEIQELLFHFVKGQKKALVVVTHNQQLAANCQKQYRLQDGKLLLL